MSLIHNIRGDIKSMPPSMPPPPQTGTYRQKQDWSKLRAVKKRLLESQT